MKSEREALLAESWTPKCPQLFSLVGILLSLFSCSKRRSQVVGLLFKC